MAGWFFLDKVESAVYLPKLVTPTGTRCFEVGRSIGVKPISFLSGFRSTSARDKRKTMQADIHKMFRESAEIKLRFVEQYAVKIESVARRMAGVLHSGGKVLIFGNGGSAADAQHLAAEFVNRFLRDRQALAAVALPTDTSALTSIGNDLGFDQVFSRQVEALARPGDLVVAISTSGNSPNVLRGVEAARRLGCATVALTGGSGGVLAKAVDEAFVVPSTETPRIQETHITLGHALCALVDEILLSAGNQMGATCSRNPQVG
jgi:D-sedoheptulose 7-phosphate isomerase